MYTTNRYKYSLDNKYYSCIIRVMRYTFKQFKEEYPDDDACLEAVFQNRYGDLPACPKCGVVNATFHRVRGRQCYACAHCGGQLHPLANTIFRKSSTSLWNWFYAIYMFSVSKNGISAKELERHLGVTYKTAWRMCKQIRLLMEQETGHLYNIVEADETYIGGRKKLSERADNKTAVLGAVEKHGQLRTQVALGGAALGSVSTFIRSNVAPYTILHTDKSKLYNFANEYYFHKTIDHGKKIWVQDGVHTNTIESFWSQFKNSIRGTYHYISPKYMQLYLNQFTFMYNHRDEAICPLLLNRV